MVLPIHAPPPVVIDSKVRVILPSAAGDLHEHPSQCTSPALGHTPVGEVVHLGKPDAVQIKYLAPDEH